MDGAGPADAANGRAAHSPLENRRTAAGFPHRPPAAHNGVCLRQRQRRERRAASAGPQRDHVQRSAGRLPEQTLTLPCHWEWNENRESVPLGVERNRCGLWALSWRLWPRGILFLWLPVILIHGGLFLALRPEPPCRSDTNESAQCGVEVLGMK